MRKLILSILTLASVALPLAAQAYPGELRDDRRELRREYRDLQDARRFGNRGEIREERGELRDAKREYREDLRERRYDGGRYVYPRGYAYRYWGNGAYLPRAYWIDRYYIGRPAIYGLPGPYRGVRWMRVGPDALLIRVRTGQIIRVVRNLYY